MYGFCFSFGMRSLCLVLAVLSSPLLQAGGPKDWALPDGPSMLGVITPPPSDGGAADLADLHAVEGMQASATRTQLAHAEKIVNFTVFLFSDVRGDGFNAAAYPETASFFKKLESESNRPKNWIKDHYHRLRPYMAHSNLVKSLVTPEDGFSYPSGHAVRSWLDALVLGELDPPRRAAYLGCAWQVNIDRVIGGMHYPSDTAAGRTLAESLFADLMADPAFKADLEALRKKEY